ncbi:MAG TPA: MlaD family protein [Opitutaceae bacterium]|nr:MlaD family protein [Opitutaceae bacterium]
MNKSQQTARIGLFFLLGVALIWVTFETLSGNKFFHHGGYTLLAGFDDLKQLKVDDDVRLAGVKIGTVTKATFTGTRAEATLEINQKYKIPNDSVASIAMAGLLGSDYVAVKLGTPGGTPYANGQEIRTAVTPDFNSVMADLGDLGHKLDGALSSLSGALNGNGGADNGLLGKLNTLLTENQAKISATMTNLQEITDKINQGQGTMGKLVNDPSLHDQLLSAVKQIQDTAAQAKDFVANAQGVVDQIKSGKGALGTIIYDEQAAANIKASLQNVRDVSDKIAKGEGTLGKLINDDSLFNTAQNALNKADRAIDGLNDSGPITAVGIAANALF